MPAPIALFAYRRISHLERTLHALKECPEFGEHQLFIFSDGAKNIDAENDVARVRAFLRTQATENIAIVERPRNFGLANSIITAVTDLCSTYGSVIVIEDDLIVHPSTLSWFNEALDKYREDERVWQISAHQFLVPHFQTKCDGIFLKMTTSWGWATWKRAWDHFDPTADGWETLLHNPALRRAFNLNGSYNYAGMLERQMAGQIDSWAVRWWWSVFKGNGYALFPPRSLVNNIGFDETATHSRFGRIRKIFSQERPPLTSADFVVPEDFCFSMRDQLKVDGAIRYRKIYDVLERLRSSPLAALRLSGPHLSKT